MTFCNEKGEKLLVVKLDDSNYVFCNETGMSRHT